ncbi:hypothetical protein AUR04nite_07230 [Glutamicibacter uratoxydans]|uniref:Uncharacterized protein n=1 Tax=Glutamicibacter uratoxydans TaxID=43667 RepID=A0A4Y4DRR1_GLUUR|nr:hypothetical protein [Glutamicibacter uratoxydans]GED05191.1 hypothetical protein AUR04nite_07230 [Glutamicibacter uratoxydans]
MPTSYLNVDFVLPLIGVGAAGVFLVFGIPMLIHAQIRKAKFNKLSDGYQTHALRSSIRLEKIIGISSLVAVVALCAGSWFGFGTAKSNLQANIEQKYQPSELSLGSYNGSWITADLTLPDGTKFKGVTVDIQDGGEPFIEDVWYHYNPKPAG